MLKLFSILSFVFLYLTIASGQAFIDIPLLANDGSVPSPIEIAVGLDLTATNGIDPSLGEASLPPLAPGLDVRFDLSPYGTNATTYKDYRAPGAPPAFPYSGTIQHTIILQHSAAGLAITLDYDLPTGAEMTITDQIGGSFLNLGPFTGVGTATIPGAYLDIFTKAFLNMIYTDIVPVELTSFTAVVSDQAVLLNWATATELNNLGFEIERKIGEQNWSKVGFVNGHGTTTEPQAYSFTDVGLSSGNYNYRIKQMDFDGSYKYYSLEQVVEIGVPETYDLSQNYPNPFNPTTKIKYSVPADEFVKITIYNLLGEKVTEIVNNIQKAGNYEVTFDATSFASGMYLYRMESGNFISVKKMLILK